MSDRKIKFSIDTSASPEPDMFMPPDPLRAGAHVTSLPGYYQTYDKSTHEADAFWLEIARQLYFREDSNQGFEYNFDVRKGPIYTRFMAESKTNISYNCLERIIEAGYGDKIAYYWAGNEPNDETSITYKELHSKVVCFSAVLRSKGVKKGDVVSIYLPMIIEVAIAMLACSRIGAPHSVVFGGFSAESLAQRIVQTKSKILITADAVFRGSKLVPLKSIADQAIKLCMQNGHQVNCQIIVEHIQRITLPNQASLPVINWTSIDCKWEEEMKLSEGVDSPVEWVDAEDSLFILFTSGSTGVPKGILHTTAGYMTYAFATTKYVFDIQSDDIYWCTADAGWITGHTYGVYGPLLNGVTSVFFEGLPTYPNAGRNWQIVEKHKVTKFYTSPTAIRCLMSYGNELVSAHNRSSLKVIGTVGEPINPKAWLWLYEIIGERKAAIVDTYWQTETGGHVIAPLPGATPTKPGSATLPFFGVRPVILDNNGGVIEGPGEGNLCFKAAWPGISRSILGDHERFEKTYFKAFPGYYFTGDGARRDQDGYYWVTGRVDDLMNVSGHLLSTAEIESALSAHPNVVESAVVAVEHHIKGHSVYAYIYMGQEKRLDSTIVSELKQLVREKIGAIAVPDTIHEASSGLPKTRSGKVTRRILRKIAEGDQKSDLGDISTLVDSGVIAELWLTRAEVRTG